jgi:hypothetical protein
VRPECSGHEDEYVYHKELMHYSACRWQNADRTEHVEERHAVCRRTQTAVGDGVHRLKEIQHNCSGRSSSNRHCHHPPDSVVVGTSRAVRLWPGLRVRRIWDTIMDTRTKIAPNAGEKKRWGRGRCRGVEVIHLSWFVTSCHGMDECPSIVPDY